MIKDYLGRSNWTVVVATESQDFAEDRLYHYLMDYRINRILWNWSPTSKVILELNVVKGGGQ